MDEGSIDEWENEADDCGGRKGGEINYVSSNHVTFSSISLLAPGGFGGLGELGVSLV